MWDVPTTVANQRAYFLSGATLDIDWRLDRLKDLRSAILKHEDALLDGLRLDLGKCAFEAYETEIGVVLEGIGHTMKHLKKWARPKKVKTGLTGFPGKSHVYTTPLGLACIMSPWNYPFHLTMMPLVASIAAGDCSVIKPSRYSSHTAQAMQEMLEQTFEPQYISLFQGDSSINNEMLAEQFDFIFFTGSITIGKLVMDAASKNLTPVVLELGGKSPAVVDETADIALAAKRIMWGKLINAGQTCVAPDYVLVHRSKEQELLAAMKAAVLKFYGNDPLHNDEFCKIINEKHYQRLCGLLGKENGDIYMGGQQIEQLQKIAPTIMTNVRLDGQLMADEIFGPILPVIPYDSFDQVVSLIRSKHRPLAAYLFTRDTRLQKWFIENITFGGGCINDVVMQLSNPNMPFGGVGYSGMGRYHGKDGFVTFSHVKSILDRGLKPDISVRYAPYGNKLGLLRKLLK